MGRGGRSTAAAQLGAPDSGVTWLGVRPRAGMREFTRRFFKHCPMLAHFQDQARPLPAPPAQPPLACDTAHPAGFGVREEEVTDGRTPGCEGRRWRMGGTRKF